MDSERPRKRTKRDSATNLYNRCQISGNCPEDVKNKIEGTTLADKLLKILSSIVYFGGLGIGTGKGTGGATGYRPLGSGGGGGRVTPDGTVIRPNIVVEPVGPPEIVPIDALSPGSSSIIPMVEAGPELIIPETIPDLTIGETEVITEADTIDITGPGGAPAVSTIDDTSAVIEVTPTGPPPRRVATSTSRFSNPTFVSVSTGPTIPQQGATNTSVFIDGLAGAEVVGEEIPLDTFNEPEEFEIEETPQPRSSTPLAFSRAFGRARELYNRRVRQIRTQNINFLTRAPQAVQFSFENPAFDHDVTLEFEQDLNQLAAAPDPDFADIVKLQRPRFSETNEGRVRLSRLGTKGTIRLRSGTQIGETVHYYYDLSSIENAEAIELSVLGEHSGDATIINPIAESTFVDAENSEVPLLFSEQELLDDITEDFSNSHIVLSAGGSRRSTLAIPTLPPGVALRVFVDDFGSGLFVSHPTSTDSITNITVPISDLGPSILIDEFSSEDFVLHPSLTKRRKRKRLYSDF